MRGRKAIQDEEGWGAHPVIEHFSPASIITDGKINVSRREVSIKTRCPKLAGLGFS
jgi:hypothetical protein